MDSEYTAYVIWSPVVVKHKNKKYKIMVSYESR